MSLHLGLDLGGTNLKWAVVEGGADLRLIRTDRVPTDTSRGERSVVGQLIEVARAEVNGSERIDSIGLGMPGFIDPEAGITRLIPNIPGNWDHVPVIAQMTEALGMPVGLVNDARAFTLAEHRLGAGRGATSMLGITLGTGVGGGLILGGRLYLGYSGTAGEFGHQTILPDGPRCNCGNYGCLEAVARADAIAAACGQPTAEEAVAAARAGDRRAREGLIAAGRYLGIGAANAVVLLSVDRVVVGGGVAAAGDLLLEPIRKELVARVHVSDVARVTVVCAELGVWAGAIGAALFGAQPKASDLHFV
jgi:glucokinase